MGTRLLSWPSHSRPAAAVVYTSTSPWRTRTAVTSFSTLVRKTNSQILHTTSSLGWWRIALPWLRCVPPHTTAIAVYTNLGHPTVLPGALTTAKLLCVLNLGPTVPSWKAASQVPRRTLTWWWQAIWQQALTAFRRRPSVHPPMDTSAPVFPHSLQEALQGLEDDKVMCEALGDEFIEWFLTEKRDRWGRGTKRLWLESYERWGSQERVWHVFQDKLNKLKIQQAVAGMNIA